MIFMIRPRALKLMCAKVVASGTGTGNRFSWGIVRRRGCNSGHTAGCTFLPCGGVINWFLGEDSSHSYRNFVFDNNRSLVFRKLLPIMFSSCLSSQKKTYLWGSVVSITSISCKSFDTDIISVTTIILNNLALIINDKSNYKFFILKIITLPLLMRSCVLFES